jgi:NAD(P)-dependent dehydrogenase (short-subunit alcohol dehydrogenase family)
MQLLDKVALIVGGRRIGAVVAVELARRGADVALSYRRSKLEAERTVAAVAGLGRRAVAIPADVTSAAECEALVQSAVTQLGRLDVLVNMASVYVHRPFDELTPEDWDANLATDLRAGFLCSRAAVPFMRRSGGGRIVNFSDWLSRSGRPRYPGYLPYYVAKAGVIGLTEALALELAKDGILVNAVAPGPILPPAEMPKEESESVEDATPLGRWGGEIEITKAVLALIESDFITGETVRVDGGRHLR